MTFAESREIISRNGGAHDALGLRQRRVVFFGAGENDALRFAARASSRKLSGFLARPISSATMSLLALVSNEVRPERGKSLRCRFRGQTIGGRTELFQAVRQVLRPRHRSTVERSRARDGGELKAGAGSPATISRIRLQRRS